MFDRAADRQNLRKLHFPHSCNLFHPAVDVTVTFVLFHTHTHSKQSFALSLRLLFVLRLSSDIMTCICICIDKNCKLFTLKNDFVINHGLFEQSLMLMYGMPPLALGNIHL